MGKISNIFKQEKEGYSTISRIWSDPPFGAPSYYWTYVAFDCNIKGNVERITIRLGRFQCKKFVKKNFTGDTGYLVAKGDKLISWKPVSKEQPLSPKSDIKVFISYSQKWQQDAEYISQFFNSYGLNVWFDKDRLKVGDRLNKEIVKHIRECTYFVPLLSQDYFNSEWCVKEFELAAKSSSLSILPIKVSEKKLIMPPHFEHIYKDILDEPIALDLRKNDSIANIKRLAESMRNQTISPMHRQNRKNSNDVSPSAKMQIDTNGISAKSALDSIPETIAADNREYYRKRINQIINKVNERNEKKEANDKSVQKTGWVSFILASAILLYINRNSLISEKIFKYVFISFIIAIVCTLIRAIEFYPQDSSANHEIKKEIRLSKLDRIALFELKDFLENNKKLNNKIKDQTLKVVLKEFKRVDL